MVAVLELGSVLLSLTTANTALTWPLRVKSTAWAAIGAARAPAMATVSALSGMNGSQPPESRDNVLIVIHVIGSSGADLGLPHRPP